MLYNIGVHRTRRQQLCEEMMDALFLTVLNEHMCAHAHTFNMSAHAYTYTCSKHACML